MDKPVTEVQNIASQVLAQHLAGPGVDRNQVKTLRRFLRQPLVGAAVSRLRDALHDYGTSSDVAPLIATVQDLYNQQGPPISTPHRMQAPLAHSDLHLVCYEFVI